MKNGADERMRHIGRIGGDDPEELVFDTHRLTLFLRDGDGRQAVCPYMALRCYDDDGVVEWDDPDTREQFLAGLERHERRASTARLYGPIEPPKPNPYWDSLLGEYRQRRQRRVTFLLVILAMLVAVAIWLRAGGWI